MRMCTRRENILWRKGQAVISHGCALPRPQLSDTEDLMGHRAASQLLTCYLSKYLYAATHLVKYQANVQQNVHHAI